MKKASKQYFPIVYNGAGHGFMRQGESISDENNPDRRAHDLAWGRWKEKLAQLGKQ
jgi:carboxymethylenebutenolidase